MSRSGDGQPLTPATLLSQAWSILRAGAANGIYEAIAVAADRLTTPELVSDPERSRHLDQLVAQAGELFERELAQSTQEAFERHKAAAVFVFWRRQLRERRKPAAA